MSSKTTIAIVDDDPGILRSLRRLLSARGYAVLTYSSAEEFLSAGKKQDLGCAVLDLSMPGIDGLQLQEKLRLTRCNLPVIFLSGDGDIPATVTAIKGGAINFLTKPVDVTDLTDAIRLALMEGEKARARAERQNDLRQRFDKLTPREREVLKHVISGKLNKQIAADLSVTEQTIKIHRMRITERTALYSVAELVRAASQLGIEPVAFKKH